MAEDFLERVLAQNTELIAVVKELALSTSPVEIIKALNPPLAAQPAPRSPYDLDPEHPDPERLDPWANPEIPFNQLVGDPDWAEVPVPSSREDEPVDG